MYLRYFVMQIILSNTEINCDQSRYLFFHIDHCKQLRFYVLTVVCLRLDASAEDAEGSLQRG